VRVVVGVDVGPTGVEVRVGVGVQKNTPGGGGFVGATIGVRAAVTPGVGSTTVGVVVFVPVGVGAGVVGVTVPVTVGVGVRVKGVRVAVDVTVKVAVGAATTTAGTGVMHGRPNGRNGGFPPAPGPCTLLVTVNTGVTLVSPAPPGVGEASTEKVSTIAEFWRAIPTVVPLQVTNVCGAGVGVTVPGVVGVAGEVSTGLHWMNSVPTVVLSVARTGVPMGTPAGTKTVITQFCPRLGVTVPTPSSMHVAFTEKLVVTLIGGVGQLTAVAVHCVPGKMAQAGALLTV